jgi:DNA polymerase-3 subunit epsilon
MRQLVLDTETTGLDPASGHRIIEIGCIEMLHRKPTGNRFHVYLNPEREVDAGAVEVHGLSNEFLADKPRFVDIATDFVSFVQGAELIIHNAPFDVGFLDHELRLLASDYKAIVDYCDVLDTLAMARKKHPGQRNSLDALCKRYNIDNKHRSLHGALLDAEILAEVYLAMTGGQTTLLLDADAAAEHSAAFAETGLSRPAFGCDRPALKVVHCSETEENTHIQRLAEIDKASGGHCLWNASEAVV